MIRIASRGKSVAPADPSAVTRSARQWIVRGSAALVVVYLVAVHAMMLWHRVLSASLLEPLIALRWSATVVLLAVMVRFLRLGVPLFRGRRGVGFWLVVLLLHLSFSAPAIAVEDPHSGLTLVLALPVVGGAVAYLLFSHRRPSVRTESPLRRWSWDLLSVRPWHSFRSGFSAVLACRPPPLV